MIDDKYLDDSSTFHPQCASLKTAALRAGEREHEREEERREMYEKGLVDPCKCTWEKPTPQQVYDQETLSMYDRHRSRWGGGAEDTMTAEEMSRRP